MQSAGSTPASAEKNKAIRAAKLGQNERNERRRLTDFCNSDTAALLGLGGEIGGVRVFGAHSARESES